MIGLNGDVFRFAVREPPAQFNLSRQCVRLEFPDSREMRLRGRRVRF